MQKRLRLDQATSWVKWEGACEDPIVGRLMKLGGDVSRVKRGDVVVFRLGDMEPGQFRVGKVTEVLTGNGLAVHEYGTVSKKAQNNVRALLRARYREKWLTRQSELVLGDRPQGGDRVEREISRWDLLTGGFKLENEMVPGDLQFLLKQSILLKPSLFPDEPRRAYLLRTQLGYIGEHLDIIGHAVTIQRKEEARRRIRGDCTQKGGCACPRSEWQD